MRINLSSSPSVFFAPIHDGGYTFGPEGTKLHTIILSLFSVRLKELPEWVYHLVATVAILHLTMAACLFLPGRLAPRLFTPIFSANFHLLWKLSWASCLAKWRNDIQTALDEQMRVSVL